MSQGNCCMSYGHLIEFLIYSCQANIWAYLLKIRQHHKRKGMLCFLIYFFFWKEVLALSFNDRLSRWKVTWKPNGQRDFSLPLLCSQGGNEEAEKKLSVRKEADRSNGQAFQKQPNWEQTSSCSQSKPAGQPAPELAPDLKHKPKLPMGSCSVAPIFHAAPQQQAGITKWSHQECDSWIGRGMSVCTSAFPLAKADLLLLPHSVLCKAHLGAGLGTSERECPGEARTWCLILDSGWNVLHASARISNRPMQQGKMQPSVAWLAFIRENPAGQRHVILSCRLS